MPTSIGRGAACLLAAGLFVAATATAQLTPIAPFTGQHQEGYETQSYTHCVPGRVFGDRADLCTPGYNGCLVTYGWLLYVGYAVYPRNGSNSFLGTSLGHAELVFDQPVQRFGSWFCTVGYLAGGSATFYDAAGAVLGTQPLTAPRGNTWAWNGWDAGAGPKIKRVEMVANDPYNGGALLCLDDSEMDIAVGTITTRPTGCGTLGIAASGLPVLGDTVTATLSGVGSPVGLLVGFPLSTPIGPCPGCTLGVDGGTVMRRSYALDIPNNPAFLDLVVSMQGFAFGSGPCLGAVALSPTLDVRIGL